MKVILEMINGVPYLYTEKEAHFKVAQATRTSERVTLDDCHNDCNLADYGDNFHIVISEVGPGKAK